ncbi:hybrid sensor histidine kinase/response regulator [Salinispira pacifica]|uniref:histidine kinase n=1 Tax=Salinispira pacifica TaxID=1307761 RepID=V5WIH1_9SPIO|nr:response regulator [Salinispira pacifica]AHC15617.1 Response regulatory protein [Salinispira pacifica]
MNEPVHAEVHTQRSNPWILLVDDEPRNLQLAGKMLSNQGHDVSFAQSGEEALKIVEHEIPDLIVLDIMMPGMDGYEVSRKIRENHPSSDIPIIFLSARTDTQGMLESFQAGGVDFISKPFHPEEFLARVNVHLELRQAKKRLEEEMSFRQRLFTIIAHDLRSPFNSIIGTLDVLKSSGSALSEEERDEFITILYNASHQELLMMDNLLQWARSQFEGVKKNTRIYNIRESARRVCKELGHMADHKEIHLHVDEDFGSEVEADSTMIQIVLRNLVSNALKFTPRGGEIGIGGMAGMTDGRQEYRVFVRDSGSGVENTETLFKLGNYHTTPGTEFEKGSGLGLHLCRDFVHANGGKLWLERSSSQGSVFAFSLPKAVPGTTPE